MDQSRPLSFLAPETIWPHTPQLITVGRYFAHSLSPRSKKEECRPQNRLQSKQWVLMVGGHNDECRKAVAFMTLTYMLSCCRWDQDYAQW